MALGRWSALLVWVCALACGSYPVREQASGAAGSASTTPPMPADQAPPDEGEPDDLVPLPVPLSVPCKYEQLADFCASSDCPSSPDSFDEICGVGVALSQGRTSCAGTVVVQSLRFVQEAWYFDAQGTLTGVVSTSDEVVTCADGHHTNTRVYGVACAAQGGLQDACGAADACGAPLTCDAGPACPLRAADVLASFCSEPSTLDVSATGTTCGGAMVTVERADEQVRHCYDTQDRLIGVATRMTGDASWNLIGTDCRAEGKVTYPCVPL
jgi:hypothetical protein